MDVLKESGGLNILVRDLTHAFYKTPFLLLLMLALVIIFPGGAITGSGTVAVLATGGVVGPLLMGMGIPAVDVAVFVALSGGVLSLIAPPPVNVYAMVIAAGLNLPYAGFFLNPWPFSPSFRPFSWLLPLVGVGSKARLILRRYLKKFRKYPRGGQKG